MKPDDKDLDENLLRRLHEAQETLDAICRGACDAVVVDGAQGQQIYTLESPDQPFRIFVEQMQEGALTLDTRGTILYCNPYFAALVNLPAAQILGSPIADWLEHSAREACLAHLAAAAQEERGRMECRLNVVDGTQVLVEFGFSTLPGSGGLVGAVVTDLTAREQAKQLELERKAAEEANEARDQFIATISHELRTPLNAIMGWVQVLGQRRDLPAEAVRALTIIERSGWAQAQLIDDLLDVSRVLAGKLRLEMAAVELAPVINAAITSVQPEADAKQIRLLSALDGPPVVIEGDAARLRQVVANLLGNAVKYTPEGGEVRVTLHQVDSHAEFEIADTGAGIAPEFLPKVFGLFEQRETGMRRRSGGLGLGLAIVKQLVDLHGGDVRLSSEGEGRGTQARVRLPLPVEATAAHAPPGAEHSPALTGLSILLVEDDAQARDTLAALLRGRRHGAGRRHGRGGVARARRRALRCAGERPRAPRHRRARTHPTCTRLGTGRTATPGAGTDRVRRGQ